MDSAANNVLVEGRFYEINPSGKPIDQVWLGLTKDELIKSEIDNEDRADKRTAKGKTTRKKGAQHRRKTLPLKSIQILVIDDRAKRIAVATNKNTVTFYEMCRPSYDWVKWRHVAGKTHQKQRSTSHRDNDVGRYVTYPIVCREVTDRAVQTDPLPDPSARRQRGKTYLDELEPIVVQEYQVTMDRVTFCDQEEIFVLCKTPHNVGCLKSRSTTFVEDRKQSRIPRKSSSCPWLWKPPEFIHKLHEKKQCNHHFARRELNEEEVVMLEKMQQYRQNQGKASKVSRKWKIDYKWKWDDGDTGPEVDLDVLVNEVKNMSGFNPPEIEKENACRHCGQTKQPSSNTETPAGKPHPLESMNADDVRELHAGEIAMQLSVRDRNLLWLLTQSNLTRLALSSQPGSLRRITRCVALQKMAAWQRRIPRLVATEVMDQPSQESSVESLKLFITVAEFCWIIHNFNSFINVMRGLQFYSVYRNGIIWENVQKSDPNICQLYLTLCDKMLSLISRLYKNGPGKKRLPVKDASIPWFPAVLCRLVNEVHHQQDRSEFRRDNLKFHPVTLDSSNLASAHDTDNMKPSVTAKAKDKNILQQIRQKVVDVAKVGDKEPGVMRAEDGHKKSVLDKAYKIISGDESADPDSEGDERSWLGVVQRRVTKVTHDLPESLRSTLKKGTSRESIPKTTTTRKSLLPSGLDFSSIKNRFTGTNKNSNAKETCCQVCFSNDCHYLGEPGKLLLEVQLSAARYKYFSNPKADAFLTRRPVLSDYLLVENYLQGRT